MTFCWLRWFMRKPEIKLRIFFFECGHMFLHAYDKWIEVGVDRFSVGCVINPYPDTDTSHTAGRVAANSPHSTVCLIKSVLYKKITWLWWNNEKIGLVWDECFFLLQYCFPYDPFKCCFKEMSWDQGSSIRKFINCLSEFQYQQSPF